MGSGTRKYKNRPKKFSLGKFEEDKDKPEVKQEEKDQFINWWEELKKRKKEERENGEDNS